MSLRNVIYYNSSNDQISLAGIAQLPYTDVIIANLQPTSPSNLTLQGYGPAFDRNLKSNIQALKNAGKNVLISFGGAEDNLLTTANYKRYAGNVNGLVNDIVNNWVLEYGFNGVDIDDEDDAGFTGAYDGIGFLVALTQGLYQALPSGQNLITHAPAPGFWFPGDWNNAYATIWQQAGDQIAWINCQFYDNDVDTAAAKVNTYQQIADIMGSEKLLLGALVGDPSILGTGDTGYITLDDMINNVIAPLKAQYGSQFGGIMGWEFAQDGPPTYGTAGAWANGIGQALGASATTNLYVFHQGEDNDGQLWYSSNNNINWTADTQVQNVGMSGSPSAVLWADGISVFHQGGENTPGSLWYDYFDGTKWYGDTLVPNLGMSGSPSAVVYDGLLYVFHQGFGNNGQLWYSSNDGTNWAPDTQVQNLGMSESPSAVLWAGGISVFHRGGENTPGSLWYDYFDGTNWYGDTLVPNLGISGSPSTVVYNGLLYVFHQGPNNDGQLWYSANDGTNWTADTQVQNVGMSGSPWAVLWAGGISVFHHGFGNNGSLWYSYFDGTNWYPDTLVPNLSISGSPSCVVR